MDLEHFECNFTALRLNSLSASDTMDFSAMTLTQIKRQEMDAQVRGYIFLIAHTQNII